MPIGLLAFKRLSKRTTFFPARAAVGFSSFNDFSLSAKRAGAAGANAFGFRTIRVCGCGGLLLALVGRVGGRCDVTIGVVIQNLRHDIADHGFHPLDKSLRLIFFALNLSESLLPKSG